MMPSLPSSQILPSNKRSQGSLILLSSSTWNHKAGNATSLDISAGLSTCHHPLLSLQLAVQGVGADASYRLCTCWVGLSDGMALPALLGLSFLGMTPVLVTYTHREAFTFVDIKLPPSKAPASAFILKLRFPFF